MFNFGIPSSIEASIGRFDRKDLIDKLVGLSLCPEYQSNHLRILTLIHVALVRACGKKLANQNNLSTLLNGLRDHDSGRNEDPAEDVFVSAVSTPGGQFRIFNGIYSASDFSLQRLLNAVFSQEFSELERLSVQATALLAVSEAVANRCGWPVDTYAPSEQWRTKWPISVSQLMGLGRNTRFTDDELAKLGIDRSALDPFCLDSVEGLLRAPFGHTALARRPLLIEEDGLSLPIPSLVSPALRLHLAHSIASGLVPKKAIEAFHGAQLARWLLLDFPVRKTKPIQTENISFPELEIDVPALNQAVLRFDEDKVAHLLVIEADWSHPPERAINELRRAPHGSEQILSEYISHSASLLQVSQDVSRGLTLVVYDSPGWNVNYLLPDNLGRNWFCVGLSTYSLATLLSDPGFTLLDLWKMLVAKQRMETAGIRVLIWPDMLNYWSIWKTFDANFLPKNLDLRRFGAFCPDTSKIIDVVLRVRRIRKVHAKPLPSGEWRQVERWVDEDVPSGESIKPIFVDPMAFVLGELRGVVETEHGPWWVAVARPPFNPEERRFFYLLWQAATEWMRRIASTAGCRLRNKVGPLEIRLLSVPETIQDAPSQIDFVTVEGTAVITVVLPPTFIGSLATPDNSGEGILAAALLDGVLNVLGLTLDSSERNAWVAELLAEPALKMIHVTSDNDVGFVVDLVTDKMPLRFLQESDLASADRYMRDELAPDVRPETQHLEGNAAVQRALHSAVDVHWKRCRTLLQDLNRTETLVLISRLIEAVHRDRVDSERGALARTHLYADSPEYDLWATMRVGRRDTAFNAYRVAGEMALCEASRDGGRHPGVSDIDMLAAEIQSLIKVAHYSDGIKYGLMSPEFDFWPDGAIEFKNDEIMAFMQEYTAASLGESIALDIDAYPKLFDERIANPSESTEDETGFFAAFEAEFDISLADAAEVMHALQGVCVGAGLDVVVLKRSALEGEVQKQKTGPGSETIARFLKAFGMLTRRAWDAPLVPPLRGDDVWPWLFERRLSLMLRPVLILSDETDPDVIYGIRQIDMGLHYASILLEMGIWPKDKLQSLQAQTYVDCEINRRGGAFEHEIAKLVRDSEWRAFEGVSMRSLGAPDEFGDVDVLAVSPDKSTWIVIECKWFGAARTPREIANWLQNFRGQEGDKLHKHLRRFDWIQKHIPDVSAALALQSSPKNIMSKIVTTRPVPLAFTAHLPTGSDLWTRREIVTALRAIEQI